MDYKFELEINEPGMEKCFNQMQAVCDSEVIRYLRMYEPVRDGIMKAQTKRYEPGLVIIDVPYAHYQNEGIVYVDPVYKIGAFHDDITGRYWSRPGVKKIPSANLLNNGMTSHFVEKTLTHKEDIIKKVVEVCK